MHIYTEYISVPKEFCHSTIMEFNVEFQLGHGNVELVNAELKIVEKPLFMAQAEFPFSESRILGGLFTALL